MSGTMTACDFCGICAVDPQTGQCSYCPDHKKRLAAEAKALAAEAKIGISIVDDDVTPAADVPAPKSKRKAKK